MPMGAPLARHSMPQSCEFFVKFRWLTDCKQTGEKRFGQYPSCACTWAQYDVPEGIGRTVGVKHLRQAT